MRTVSSYRDSLHDAVVTSPRGGYFGSVTSVSFEGRIDGGVSVPAYAPESTMACRTVVSGRNSVRAFAISDLSEGAVRAGSGVGSAGGGTSVILEIDADMPMTTMVRAAITSMEAVTCVLQDLDVRDGDGNVCSGCSNLSMAVVRNRGSDLYLRGAGKHSRLGQVIAESVYGAVRESALANGLPMPSGGDALSRLGRAGADTAGIIAAHGGVDRDQYLAEVEGLSSDERMVALASAIVSVSDGMAWGLIPEEAGVGMGRSMIGSAIGGDVPPGDDLVSALAEALTILAESKVE